MKALYSHKPGFAGKIKGMIRTDYHIHSTHSPDGHNTPAEICRQALAQGMTEIAITDHMEWKPGARHMQPDFDRYFADLAACRDEFGPAGLTVLSGVELGNPHEYAAEADALLAARSFDVVIGSIHWLDGWNIHDARCFDGRDPYAVYTAYFASMAAMARDADFDLVAHFDRIFWAGSSRHGPPRPERLEPAVRPVLEAMADRGRVLELNGRFLTHDPGWNDTLVAVMGWFREAGDAGVVINSDAHRVSEIGRNREVGVALLAEAGFEEPARLGVLVTLP